MPEDVIDVLFVKELNVGGTPGGAGGGSVSKPSLSFGDGDSGFYESADDEIRVSLAGTYRWSYAGVQLHSSTAAGPAIRDEAATSTNPTLLPNRADADTGIGWGVADTLSLVAGSISAVQLKEESNHVIQMNSSNVGLTADVGSSQGDGVILSSYNVYDTVANAGDAATLPATFFVGTIIYVKNGAAANSMDVFPAAGDDLGAGANTAVAVDAGDFKVFLATTANATWEQIMGGTA